MIDNGALSELVAQARQWRRHLHAHPETAFEEFETAAFIAEKLKALGMDVHTGIATTGVVASIRRGNGRSIALRADMDALHLTETNSFPYRSTKSGKMHGCGHDGHSAMLLAAAHYLSNADFSGTLSFIFQPAEENEAGAKAMIEESVLERFDIEEIYGLHNWPGLPAGTIAARIGPQMAAFDTFEVTIRGRGTHAAMPHLGNDVVVATGHIIAAIQAIVSRAIDPQKTAVVSVTQVHGGETWNVIPDTMTIRGCTRHFDTDVQKILRQSLADICENVSRAFGASAELNYLPRYPSVINTPEQTKLCQEVAATVVGLSRTEINLPPSMASEDFAFFLNKRPGCYAWIGNGSSEGGCLLHSPNYDFNDDIIETGIRYWVSLVQSRLR